MEVYQRAGSPFWFMDITVTHADGSTRRVRRSTKQRRRADAQRVAMEALKAHQEAASSPQAAPTIGEALDDYVEHLRIHGKRGKSAITARRKALGEVPGVFCWPRTKPLPTFTDQDIRQFVDARAREGMRPATIGLELANIRASFTLADRATARRLHWKAPKITPKTRWLTVEEWRTIYQEMDPDALVLDKWGNMGPPNSTTRRWRQQARDLFVVLTLTGGRWSEVARMTVDQVREDGVLLYSYKTSTPRIVPVPAEAREVLDRRVAEARAAGLRNLFPSVDPRQGHARSGSIERSIRRAGVNTDDSVQRWGKVTVHTLRHTFASWLLQGVGGADPMDIAGIKDLLGHTTIGMTMRYAHLAKGKTVAQAQVALSGITGRTLNVPSTEDRPA